MQLVYAINAITDGRMDGLTEERTDGRKNKRTGGWPDGGTNGHALVYRAVSTRRHAFFLPAFHLPHKMKKLSTEGNG